MITYHILDNLAEQQASLLPKAAEEVATFLRTNLSTTNKGEYTPEQIALFETSFNGPKIRQRADGNYFLFATNEANEIVGCGAVTRGAFGFTPRYFHVREDYRKDGVPSSIARRLHRKLRELGQQEIVIDALKLESTLELYRKHGFAEFAPESDPEQGTPFEGLFKFMRREL